MKLLWFLFKIMWPEHGSSGQNIVSLELKNVLDCFLWCMRCIAEQVCSSHDMFTWEDSRTVPILGIWLCFSSIHFSSGTKMKILTLSKHTYLEDYVQTIRTISSESICAYYSCRWKYPKNKLKCCSHLCLFFLWLDLFSPWDRKSYERC